MTGKEGEEEGGGDGGRVGEAVVKVLGKGAGGSSEGEASAGCSAGVLDIIMEEKDGSLVLALVSERAAATSSTLVTFALVCGSSVDTEEVLLSSPWLRKSGVGEGAEWKEEESSLGRLPPWPGRGGGGEGAVSPESWVDSSRSWRARDPRLSSKTTWV